MASSEARRRRSVTQASVLMRLFRPFREFIGPGRRRSDHPLVVGTIVLCCGLLVVGSMVQVTATLWGGSQIQTLLNRERKREATAEQMRTTMIKYLESQATVMRIVCLNVSKNEKDRADCMVPVPEIPVRGTDN